MNTDSSAVMTLWTGKTLCSLWSVLGISDIRSSERWALSSFFRMDLRSRLISASHGHWMILRVATELTPKFILPCGRTADITQPSIYKTEHCDWLLNLHCSWVGREKETLMCVLTEYNCTSLLNPQHEHERRQQQSSLKRACKQSKPCFLSRASGPSGKGPVGPSLTCGSPWVNVALCGSHDPEESHGLNVVTKTWTKLARPFKSTAITSRRGPEGHLDSTRAEVWLLS